MLLDLKALSSLLSASFQFVENILRQMKMQHLKPMEWHESSAKMMICRALRRKKKSSKCFCPTRPKAISKRGFCDLKRWRASFLQWTPTRCLLIPFIPFISYLRTVSELGNSQGSSSSQFEMPTKSLGLFYPCCKVSAPCCRRLLKQLKNSGNMSLS